MRKYSHMHCNQFSDRKWQDVDFSDAGEWQVDSEGNYFRWFADVKEYAPTIIRTDDYYRNKKRNGAENGNDN